MEEIEEKKIDVLMAQLQERYNALHKMRDRSVQFSLWILGLGLGLSWLLISQVTLNGTQMIILGAFLIIIGFLALNFLRAIERGFRKNREVMIKIETLLKLHEDGYYGSADSILPKEFLEKRVKWSGHFPTLYSLIITVFIFLIVLTFTNPSSYTIPFSSATQPAKQTQTPIAK
jgi:hypothetical protein